jgi:hypothetical protein
LLQADHKAGALMKNKLSRSWSLAAALAIGVGLAFSAGGAVGCAEPPDEPAASEPAAPAIETEVQASSAPGPVGLQVVFQCLDANDAPVGLPKSTLPACQAACPAGDFCVRCTVRNNAVECP